MIDFNIILQITSCSSKCSFQSPRISFCMRFLPVSMRYHVQSNAFSVTRRPSVKCSNHEIRFTIESACCHFLFLGPNVFLSLLSPYTFTITEITLIYIMRFKDKRENKKPKISHYWYELYLKRNTHNVISWESMTCGIVSQ